MLLKEIYNYSRQCQVALVKSSLVIYFENEVMYIYLALAFSLAMHPL